MSFHHLHQRPAYRNLLAFIISLTYTDFSSITSDEVEVLLREAKVSYATEPYIMDKYPYTEYALCLECELVQETGHRNTVSFSFDENQRLLTFQLRTFL
jgi:hypothetical protein